MSTYYSWVQRATNYECNTCEKSGYWDDQIENDTKLSFNDFNHEVIDILRHLGWYVEEFHNDEYLMCPKCWREFPELTQKPKLMDQAWPSKDWKKFGNGPYQILQLGPDVFIPPGSGGHPDYACTRKQLEQQREEAIDLANALDIFFGWLDTEPKPKKETK